MNNNIKIALIGATGKAGNSILLELLNKEFQVKVLLRNPDKLKTNSPLLEIVKGDVRNNEVVNELIKDCEAVINAVGQAKGESPISSTATSNIIKAMTINNVKRYIGVTGLSIDVPGDKKGFRTRFLSALMRLLFKPYIRDKQIEYALLEESALDWTLVRIPLIDSKQLQNKTIANLFDCIGTRVHPTNLAKFIVDQIQQDEWVRKAPFVSDK